MRVLNCLNGASTPHHAIGHAGVGAVGIIREGLLRMETTGDTKDQDLAPEGSRAHLRGALSEFATMMVATYDRTGKHPRLHARPILE